MLKCNEKLDLRRWINFFKNSYSFFTRLPVFFIALCCGSKMELKYFIPDNYPSATMLLVQPHTEGKRNNNGVRRQAMLAARHFCR